VTYCALAPKSNALDVAYHAAKQDAQERMAEPVPLHIRNAPTRLMQELDYGKGYQYAHDYADGITAMECLPDSLKGRVYYQPTTHGREARVKEHYERIEAWKAEERASNKE
jgi:putative ATPase